MLDTFVLDGTVALIAMAILVGELGLIIGLAFRRGRRPNGSDVANALSGLFLILALRAAILDQGSAQIALFLALAGMAHLGDLIMRQRRS